MCEISAESKRPIEYRREPFLYSWSNVRAGLWIKCIEVSTQRQQTCGCTPIYAISTEVLLRSRDQWIKLEQKEYGRLISTVCDEVLLRLLFENSAWRKLNGCIINLSTEYDFCMRRANNVDSKWFAVFGPTGVRGFCLRWLWSTAGENVSIFNVIAFYISDDRRLYVVSISLHAAVVRCVCCCYTSCWKLHWQLKFIVYRRADWFWRDHSADCWEETGLFEHVPKTGTFWRGQIF